MDSTSMSPTPIPLPIPAAQPVTPGTPLPPVSPVDLAAGEAAAVLQNPSPINPSPSPSASFAVPNPDVADAVDDVAFEIKQGARSGKVFTTPEVAITEIKLALERQESNEATTQQILFSLIEKFHNISGADPDSINIVSELVKESGSNQIEVESFTLASKPGKTFYKVKANYTASVIVAGKKHEVSFSRTIFSLGETPEEAIAAAAIFKKTVTALAIEAYDDNATLTQDPTDARLLAMDKRSFVINFSYDKKTNHPQSVTSVQFYTEGEDGETEPTELNLQPTSTRCLLDLTTQQIKRLPPVDADDEEEPVLRTMTQVLYDSEEEAILHMPYKLIDAGLYDRLGGNNKLATYVDRAKRDIEEAKKRFAEATTFFEQSSFWSGKNWTPEFKQFLLDLEIYHEVRQGNNIDESKKRSAEVDNYIAKLDDISNMEQQGKEALKDKQHWELPLVEGLDVINEGLAASNKKLDNCEKFLNESKKALSDARTTIFEKQDSIRRRIANLQKINHDIRLARERISNLHTQALKNAQLLDADSGAQAAEVLHAVSQGFIDDVDNEMKTNQATIDKIVEALEKVDYSADLSGDEEFLPPQRDDDSDYDLSDYDIEHRDLDSINLPRSNEAEDDDTAPSTPPIVPKSNPAAPVQPGDASPNPSLGVPQVVAAAGPITPVAGEILPSSVEVATASVTTAEASRNDLPPEPTTKPPVSPNAGVAVAEDPLNLL